MNFVVLALFIVFAAYADENEFLIPMGAEEAITGNTGIGRNGSVGSVIYNPGGLAGLNSSKLSASGSAFSLNNVSSKGEGENAETKYFQTTPTQITTAFKREKFNFAFSILVPQHLKRDYIYTANDPDLGGDYEGGVSEEGQETLFGPSVAFNINSKLSLGVSVFASKRDYQSFSDAFIDNGSVSATAVDKIKISATALYPVIGALYKINGDTSVGVKFSGPSVQLGGSAEHTNNYTVDGVINSGNNKSIDVNYEKPMDFGVGVSFRASNKIKLLADVTHHFSKTYEVYKEDAVGDSEEMVFQSTTRANAGLEYQVSNSDFITLGANYNPGYEVNDLDYLGAIFGYKSLENISESSYGVFYNQGSDNSEGVKSEMKTFGLFVSTSINFINL